MIRSETGRLRSVIVHRPGLELERLTPSNKDELLFDELIWVEKAQEEHDAFAATLTDAGIEVLYLTGLLEAVLADEALAEAFITNQVGDDLCGRRLAGRVRGLMADMDPERLVTHLIGGVTFGDVGETDGLVAALHGPDDFVLAPLPNSVFMRDSSVWVGDGVILSPMNRVVRRRETALLQLVYRHHPRFADAPVWFGDRAGDHYPASVEGGDVLVVGESGLAVGISERTSPSGAGAMIARLFEEGVVYRVLAVELPRGRATMHLDTVVSMVAGDAVVIYPRIQARVRCFRVTPGPQGHLMAREVAGLADGLAWAAGVPEMRVIEPPFGKVEADREQWNDANNTFAIAPGEVVAYERNVVTNRILEDAGVTVHRIPSSELPRGRGGPRCMTCPVDRDPL